MLTLHFCPQSTECMTTGYDKIKSIQMFIKHIKRQVLGSCVKKQSGQVLPTIGFQDLQEITQDTVSLTLIKGIVRLMSFCYF